MNIDDYDDRGRTPLMNAAIDGDLVEVERLLVAGANPLIADRDFGNTTAEAYAARFARKSEAHRRIRVILRVASDKAVGSQSVPRPEPVYPEPEELSSRGVKPRQPDVSWPFELFMPSRGERVKRIRTSAFYLSALVSFAAGTYLILIDVMLGYFLAFTATLCLLLYPPIRFLFGGKDSLAAGIATVVAEEYLKSQITKGADSSRRRRKR